MVAHISWCSVNSASKATMFYLHTAIGIPNESEIIIRNTSKKDTQKFGYKQGGNQSRNLKVIPISSSITLKTKKVMSKVILWLISPLGYRARKTLAYSRSFRILWRSIWVASDALCCFCYYFGHAAGNGNLWSNMEHIKIQWNRYQYDTIRWISTEKKNLWI